MDAYFKESSQRLEEIKKEQKREKFLRWASANVKCLRKMDPDEVQILRYYYENVESWKQVVESTFAMAINHLNSDIDYNNDLEKNRRQADIALEKLNDYVKSLEIKYDVKEEYTENDSLKR